MLFQANSFGGIVIYKRTDGFGNRSVVGLLMNIFMFILIQKVIRSKVEFLHFFLFFMYSFFKYTHFGGGFFEGYGSNFCGVTVFSINLSLVLIAKILASML